MTLRTRRFSHGSASIATNSPGHSATSGTDLPLIVGMILAAKLDPASVLTMFGLMQLLTGLTYGLPMPAQPLKAMAVLVIAGRQARTCSAAEDWQSASRCWWVLAK